MKKFKKSTAIVFTCLLAVVLVIGFLFSFVPMTFGSKTFVSFSGAINISSDLSYGMYGEYDIKTENPSKTDIVNSMTKIKDVFEENGYKNVNVYAVGNKKIRVEMSFPTGSKTYVDAYSELANVGSGAFSLRSTYKLEDSSVVVQGSQAVKEIKVYTNNDTKYVSIVFNKEGEEAYKELCNTTTTVYLALGDYAQSISVSGVSDYKQFTLSDSDYENLITLEQRIKLGCLNVELDGDTAVINTMSASLSVGEASSFNASNVGSNLLNYSQFSISNDGNQISTGCLNVKLSGKATTLAPNFEQYLLTKSNQTSHASTAFIVAISAIFVVAVLGLAVFATKFGPYAIVVFVSFLFNSYLFVISMCLMPSIEIGLSGVGAIIIGMALIYTYAFVYANQIKTEYNSGKSLQAALESSYKKTLPNLLIGNIMLFFMSLVLFALSFGELTSVAIIFAVCVFLSLFTNLLLIPFMIKICNSFDNFGLKLFMLKKRSISESLSKVEESNEKEAE